VSENVKILDHSVKKFNNVDFFYCTGKRDATSLQVSNVKLMLARISHQAASRTGKALALLRELE